MNFFEAQDKARQQTLIMIALFVAAVLAMIGLINYLVLILIYYNGTGMFPGNISELHSVFAWDIFLSSTFIPISKYSGTA